MTEQPDRLDSWKAISDYLGRDIRTLQRWELLGLPVRRMPGGRGYSVFALRSEIDAWMLRGGDKDDKTDADPVAFRSPSIEQPTGPLPPARRSSKRRWVTVVLIAALAIVAWRVRPGSAPAEPPTVDVTESGVVATALDGTARWRWDFPSDELVVLRGPRMQADVIGGADPSVLVMTSHGLDRRSHQPREGVLRQFSLDGQLRRAFSFTDEWLFGDLRPFGAPWAMTAAQAETSGGATRIAVAAHHFSWWPSVVTVLDERWQRQASFVNSGWVESLRWLSPSRLLISGFNQARNGGMVALLDADALDGTSPEDAATFRCRNCGAGAPLAYVVLPRSELNRVTGSAFNRALVESSAGNVVVHTSEIDRTNNIGALIDAIYEFSPALELKSAVYGSLYWDRHRVLELEGKLRHTREQCPERDGPPTIQVWDRAHGWRTVATRAPRRQ